MMMKKITLSVLMILLSSLCMHSASLRTKVAAIKKSLPLRTELFSIDAMDYNAADNEVVAEVTCLQDVDARNIQTQIQIVGTIVGTLMTSDPGMDPFNVSVSVRTPAASTPVKFYFTEQDIEFVLNEARKLLADNESMLTLLAQEVDKMPMQCDAANNFCYIFSYDTNRKELRIDYQLFSDEYIKLFSEAPEDIYFSTVRSFLGPALKAFQKVMTEENVTIRLCMYKGTANTPFKNVRFTASEIFGE